MVQKVVDAVGDDEKLDPWFRHMIKGSYFYNLAWLHRGGGCERRRPDEHL